MDDTMPFVSVIVPALNEERTIRECLVSLLGMDYPPERREILVVDNGSTDRTPDIVKSFPVRYLREERRGASYARNRGIEESKGEILAFTDADCVVTTGWLRELVQGFEDEGVGGVEGETVAYLPVTLAECYRARMRSFSHIGRTDNPLSPYANTANVAFRREVFNRIGLFDTRFSPAGGEDVDFSWRFFQETELQLRHNPKAVVFYRCRSTVGDFFSQQMRNGRGLAILQAKYPARLPWGWRQELRSWSAVSGFAWIATRAAIRYGFQGDKKMDVYDAYFTFLRKLAVRVGFLRGTLARGR